MILGINATQHHNDMHTALMYYNLPILNHATFPSSTFSCTRKNLPARDNSSEEENDDDSLEEDDDEAGPKPAARKEPDSSDKQSRKW